MRIYMPGYCDECGGRVCTSPECQLSRMSSLGVDGGLPMPTCDTEVADNARGVHEHRDGTWWFWDEDGGIEHGPFGCEHTAVAKLGEYMESIL